MRTDQFDILQLELFSQRIAVRRGVIQQPLRLREVVLGKDADGNDVTLTLALIPPGEFVMGTSADHKSPRPPLDASLCSITVHLSIC
jgi:hypothetical protein